MAPHWTVFSADVSLVLGGQRCGLISAEQKGSISSLDMLVTLLQGTVSLLCGKGTLMVRVQLGVHQNPQVLSCRGAYKLGGPQHIPGVVSPQVQVQELALPFVELHKVCVSLF